MDRLAASQFSQLVSKRTNQMEKIIGSQQRKGNKQRGSCSVGSVGWPLDIWQPAIGVGKCQIPKKLKSKVLI